MELVPIITQILTIVAAVFIIVLLVSYIASKVRKKAQAESLPNNYNAQPASRYSINKITNPNNQYYNGNYYDSTTFNYPKGIKVVKRTEDSITPSSGRNYSSSSYGPTPAYSNSRFTVINNISTNGSRKVETDEFGFKLYSDKEISRSVYLPG